MSPVGDGDGAHSMSEVAIKFAASGDIKFAASGAEHSTNAVVARCGPGHRRSPGLNGWNPSNSHRHGFLSIIADRIRGG